MSQQQLSQKDAIVAALNKEFYEKFDVQYFNRKNALYLLLLSDIESIDRKLSEGIAVGKIKINYEPLSTNEKRQIENTLRADIVQNYYHSLETLFRLLIAHLVSNTSPWIDVAALKDFRVFKRTVEAIPKGPFDEIVPIFFTSAEELKNKLGEKVWEANIGNLREFIYHFAHQLGKATGYNSYKHGLAIFNNELGFEFGNVKVEKQDTLTFLELRQDASKKKFIHKTHRFIKWEEKVAMTYVIMAMLKNIINVGKLRFGVTNEAQELALFDHFNLNKMLSETQGGLVIEEISERCVVVS